VSVVDAAVHPGVPDLAPLIRGVGFQIHHSVAKDRRDLTELFHADGIHDSLCPPGGPCPAHHCGRPRPTACGRIGAREPNAGGRSSDGRHPAVRDHPAYSA